MIATHDKPRTSGPPHLSGSLSSCSPSSHQTFSLQQRISLLSQEGVAGFLSGGNPNVPIIFEGQANGNPIPVAFSLGPNDVSTTYSVGGYTFTISNGQIYIQQTGGVQSLQNQGQTPPNTRPINISQYHIAEPDHAATAGPNKIRNSPIIISAIAIRTKPPYSLFYTTKYLWISE
jgi:hypothetical protein